MSQGSTQGTTRFNPDQSLMSGGRTEAGGMLHTSVMTHDSQGRRKFSPFKMVPKQLEVPDPSDRLVHQQLYEHLRDVKAEREAATHESEHDMVLREKVDKDLKEFQIYCRTQEQLQRNISNQAYRAGIRKSMAESQISARFERAVYTSQFEQRGHYRQIIDPGALE